MSATPALPPRTRPVDQAHGLRRLFAHAQVRFVPVVANPQMGFSGVMLERLCAAFASLGRHTLVVDAADNAAPPKEMAVVDLAECVDALSPQMSYLAARGLPLRYVDTHGSTASFLRAVSDAAPQADVVLVHASASTLCRLFARSPGHSHHNHSCPLLMAEDRPTSVTHAYAAMKLLSQRGGMMVHDMLLGVAPHSPRAERIAQQVSTCADRFLGAVLRDWVRIDPASDTSDLPTPALRRWASLALQPQVDPMADSASAAMIGELPGQRPAALQAAGLAQAMN